MLYIFDLDHTVIDSSHRQLTREDGSLDLDNWIENCTHEKIMQDSLFPWLAVSKSLSKTLASKRQFVRLAYYRNMITNFWLYTICNPIILCPVLLAIIVLMIA